MSAAEKEESDLPLGLVREWNMPAHLSNKITVDPVEISLTSPQALFSNSVSAGKITPIRHKRVRKNLVSASPEAAVSSCQSQGTNPFGGKNISPQRTLTGKTISSVSRPKHVYRAFGMHHEVSKAVQRSWNHTFETPVHEMSIRNRSRLLNLVGPALEKMLRAFSGDAWESLLFYLSNNVMLHQRKSVRSNKHDRVSTHRDMVYRETLVRSELVKNLITTFNQVPGNTRGARDERRRLLSTIACDFPYKIIRSLDWRLPDVGEKYKDRCISRRMFHEARAHAGAFCPGGQAFHIPHVKQVTISAEMVKKVYTYMMTDHNTQKLASGSNDLVLSTGEKLSIPPVARKFLRTHLWAKFVRDHTDDNGQYNGGVSRVDFLGVAGACTSEQEKCYSALDQIKVRCGSENFEAGIRLVQDLCAQSPIVFAGYEQTLRNLITQHKTHMKNDLPSHLEVKSKCANHCVTHMFGGQGDTFSNKCTECDCGGHTERCKDCDAGLVIIAMIRGMIERLRSFNSGSIGRFAMEIEQVRTPDTSTCPT